MQTDSDTNPAFEVLASRESNGIAVQLLWDRDSNAVVVTVVDRGTGIEFAVEVADASPIDVFHHPYAYAAFRHIDTAFTAELAAV